MESLCLNGTGGLTAARSGTAAVVGHSLDRQPATEIFNSLNQRQKVVNWSKKLARRPADRDSAVGVR